MKYLLDTDHISILQKQSGAEFTVLLARIQQEKPSDLALCIIRFREQARLDQMIARGPSGA